MKVLIGTTNPAKIRRFEDLLDGCGLDFCTLKDLGVTEEPEETGTTPEENAILKARFYSRFHQPVICNDSGLYLAAWPLDDARQPGLNVRSPEGRRLNDDEMLAHYAALAHALGGRALAFYLDAIAVCRDGQMHSFMEDGAALRPNAFYLTDVPSPLRHPGWPLDSISLNRHTLQYFVGNDERAFHTAAEQIFIGEYRRKMLYFLKESLGLA